MIESEEKAMNAVRGFLERTLPVLKLSERENRYELKTWRMLNFHEQLFSPQITENESGVPVSGRLFYDEAKAEAVIVQALDGDQQADEALRTTAIEFLTRYHALPAHLARYVALLLGSNGPAPRRGPTPNDERQRYLPPRSNGSSISTLALTRRGAKSSD